VQNFDLLRGLEIRSMKRGDFYCKIHVVWAILREDPLDGLTPRSEIGKVTKSRDAICSHRNDVSPLKQGLNYTCTVHPVITKKKHFRRLHLSSRDTNRVPKRHHFSSQR